MKRSFFQVKSECPSTTFLYRLALPVSHHSLKHKLYYSMDTKSLLFSYTTLFQSSWFMLFPKHDFLTLPGLPQMIVIPSSHWSTVSPRGSLLLPWKWGFPFLSISTGSPLDTLSIQTLPLSKPFSVLWSSASQKEFYYLRVLLINLRTCIPEDLLKTARQAFRQEFIKDVNLPGLRSQVGMGDCGWEYITLVSIPSRAE
jgi:hypothetical protein